MNEFGSWIADHPWAGWVGLALILAVVELLSLDLVLLMFALGALAAAVAAGFGAPLWLCLLAFVIVTLGMLFFVRPTMAKKLHAGPDLSTGYEAIAGRTAVVDETVNHYQGRVAIMGEIWTARTEDPAASFDPSTEVTVVRIDGASLIVSRKAE